MSRPVQHRLEVIEAQLANLTTTVNNAVAAALATLKLGDLSDVTITEPTNGEALKYSDGDWINDTDATSA